MQDFEFDSATRTIVIPKAFSYLEWRLIYHLFSESLSSHVRDCVRSYTSPWLMVQHKYQEFSTGNLARQSVSRLNVISTIPQQEFEIDGEHDIHDQQDDELSCDPNKV